MHRTLHEFDWFVDAVSLGVRPACWSTKYREAEEAGNDTLAQGLKARQDLENRLQARFKEQHYNFDDGLELVRLAEAFRTYCREQYGPIQVFSRDFDDVPQSGATEERLP